jgi:hypothetical protein
MGEEKNNNLSLWSLSSSLEIPSAAITPPPRATSTVNVVSRLAFPLLLLLLLYSLVSTIHVACEQWRAIVHGSD